MAFTLHLRRAALLRRSVPRYLQSNAAAQSPVNLLAEVRPIIDHHMAELSRDRATELFAFIVSSLHMTVMSQQYFQPGHGEMFDAASALLRIVDLLAEKAHSTSLAALLPAIHRLNILLGSNAPYTSSSPAPSLLSWMSSDTLLAVSTSAFTQVNDTDSDTFQSFAGLSTAAVVDTLLPILHARRMVTPSLVIAAATTLAAAAVAPYTLHSCDGEPDTRSPPAYASLPAAVGAAVRRPAVADYNDSATSSGDAAEGGMVWIRSLTTTLCVGASAVRALEDRAVLLRDAPSLEDPSGDGAVGRTADECEALAEQLWSALADLMIVFGAAVVDDDTPIAPTAHTAVGGVADDGESSCVRDMRRVWTSWEELACLADAAVGVYRHIMSSEALGEGVGGGGGGGGQVAELYGGRVGAHPRLWGYSQNSPEGRSALGRDGQQGSRRGGGRGGGGGGGGGEHVRGAAAAAAFVLRAIAARCGSACSRYARDVSDPLVQQPPSLASGCLLAVHLLQSGVGVVPAAQVFFDAVGHSDAAAGATRRVSLKALSSRGGADPWRVVSYLRDPLGGGVVTVGSTSSFQTALRLCNERSVTAAEAAADDAGVFSDRSGGGGVWGGAGSGSGGGGVVVATELVSAWFHSSPPSTRSRLSEDRAALPSPATAPTPLSVGVPPRVVRMAMEVLGVGIASGHADSGGGGPSTHSPSGEFGRGGGGGGGSGENFSLPLHVPFTPSGSFASGTRGRKAGVGAGGGGSDSTSPLRLSATDVCDAAIGRALKALRAVYVTPTDASSASSRSTRGRTRKLSAAAPSDTGRAAGDGEGIVAEVPLSALLKTLRVVLDGLSTQAASTALRYDARRQAEIDDVKTDVLVQRVCNLVASGAAVVTTVDNAIAVVSEASSGGQSGGGGGAAVVVSLAAAQLLQGINVFCRGLRDRLVVQEVVRSALTPLSPRVLTLVGTVAPTVAAMLAHSAAANGVGSGLALTLPSLSGAASRSTQSFSGSGSSSSASRPSFLFDWVCGGARGGTFSVSGGLLPGAVAGVVARTLASRSAQSATRAASEADSSPALSHTSAHTDVAVDVPSVGVVREGVEVLAVCLSSVVHAAPPAPVADALVGTLLRGLRVMSSAIARSPEGDGGECGTSIHEDVCSLAELLTPALSCGSPAALAALFCSGVDLTLLGVYEARSLRVVCGGVAIVKATAQLLAGTASFSGGQRVSIGGVRSAATSTAPTASKTCTLSSQASSSRKKPLKGSSTASRMSAVLSARASARADGGGDIEGTQACPATTTQRPCVALLPASAAARLSSAVGIAVHAAGLAKHAASTPPSSTVQPSIAVARAQRASTFAVASTLASAVEVLLPHITRTTSPAPSSKLASREVSFILDALADYTHRSQLVAQVPISPSRGLECTPPPLNDGDSDPTMIRSSSSGVGAVVLSRPVVANVGVYADVTLVAVTRIPSSGTSSVVSSAEAAAPSPTSIATERVVCVMCVADADCIEPSSAHHEGPPFPSFGGFGGDRGVDGGVMIAPSIAALHQTSPSTLSLTSTAPGEEGRDVSDDHVEEEVECGSRLRCVSGRVRAAVSYLTHVVGVDVVLITSGELAAIGEADGDGHAVSSVEVADVAVPHRVHLPPYAGVGDGAAVTQRSLDVVLHPQAAQFNFLSQDLRRGYLLSRLCGDPDAWAGGTPFGTVSPALLKAVVGRSTEAVDHSHADPAASSAGGDAAEPGDVGGAVDDVDVAPTRSAVQAAVRGSVGVEAYARASKAAEEAAAAAAPRTRDGFISPDAVAEALSDKRSPLRPTRSRML